MFDKVVHACMAAGLVNVRFLSIFPSSLTPGFYASTLGRLRSLRNRPPAVFALADCLRNV